MNIPQQLFVTATDTDAGKTFISALLLLHLKGFYWKPIQCGNFPLTDKQQLKKMTELPPYHFLDERYLLKEPLSPHIAAKNENKEMKLSHFSVSKKITPLIVEGAGGALVPINDQNNMTDLIHMLDMPALIVTKNRVGAINHTLLTIEALRKRNIEIFGVILNGDCISSNASSIEQFGQVKVLAEIPFFPSFDKTYLETALQKYWRTK